MVRSLNRLPKCPLIQKANHDQKRGGSKQRETYKGDEERSQSLESGWTRSRFFAMGLADSAGAPSPEIGERVPLGGTGIRISSGDPGIISGAKPGILTRFASF